MNLRCKPLASAFAMIAMLGAAALVPAHAAGTGTFSMVSTSPGSQPVVISTDGGTTYINAYTGAYTGSLDGQQINVFCVDPTHEIKPGDSYQADTTYKITDAGGSLNSSGYYNGGLASEMIPSDATPSVILTATQQSGRASEVAWLTDNYLNASASTFAGGISGSTSYIDNMSAVQLSIWDIIMDGGNGLASGSLTGNTSSQSQFGSLVNYFENQAASNSSYSSSTAYWLQAPHDANGNHLQSYAYYVPPAGVPELSPASILGLGLGGVALAVAARRKRRQMARVA